jgi:suppressor of tumorigenicity protein 13
MPENGVRPIICRRTNINYLSAMSCTLAYLFPVSFIIETVLKFITDLGGILPNETSAAPDETHDEAPFPPIHESGDDMDKSAEAKQAAADLISAGDYEAAVDKYTEAIQAAPPSALLYANRALALLRCGRPRAAKRDCDLALLENPDSAKALRVRGKAFKDLELFEDALKDLSASQQVDFDEATVDDLKFVMEKHKEKELRLAEERNKEEERLRKKAADIKAAREEAKREAESANQMPDVGGMPGMPGFGGMPGMGGGMPGMGGGMPGMGGGGGMPTGMEGMVHTNVKQHDYDCI